MKNISVLTLFLFCAQFMWAQMTISLQSFATGFDNPVDIAHCGDERLFIVERSGIIKIVEVDGTILTTPFLDIESQVNDQPNEQGLLGLAFHPDYLNNGFFYVNYTIASEDSRITRFKVSDNDPNVADPASEEIILEVDQPFWNHNGGCLKFGPDGYLYASFGDGGSGGDPQNNGQKRTTHLGKILRLDMDNGLPYSIPADNPFVDDPNTLDEIWALGLRNPWRMSFDRITGDLWIGDVGQNEWEEIDFQPANSAGGENYGWRCYEGDHTFNTSNCPPMSEMVFPVMEYSNSFTDGCSITGGFVYRGCEFPEMYGHYIFGDYCSGKFWRITPDGAGGWENEELANLGNNQVAAFGENLAGQLFVAQHGNGQIAKVVPNAELLEATGETCIGTGDGSIDFTIPTDQLATIMWNDGNTDAIRTGLSPGQYEVTVTTTNGCEFIDNAIVEQGPGLGIPVEIMVENDTVLSIPDVGAVAYQWLLDNEPISGATDLTYTATESGNYSVSISFGPNCTFFPNEVNVTVVTSAIEALGIQQISISPNPFGNELTIKVSTAQNMELEMTVTDLQGQEYLRQKTELAGNFTRTFNLSELPAGVYFFQLKNKHGEWTERILKQ